MFGGNINKLEELVIWKGYSHIKSVRNFNDRFIQVCYEFRTLGRIKWRKQELKPRRGHDATN